jgi:hypothetical protein
MSTVMFIGIMASVFPLLFPERGAQMTHVFIALLLLVSGAMPSAPVSCTAMDKKVAHKKGEKWAQNYPQVSPPARSPKRTSQVQLI